MGTSEPRLIKKYANRKLYDTVDRRYVTRDIVERLRRAGEDVRIIDQTSGMDITGQLVPTLSGSRPRRGRQPARGSAAAPGQRFREQGDSVVTLVRNALMASVGAGLKTAATLRDSRAAGIDGLLAAALRNLDVVTGAQLLELQRRVDALTAAVERLTQPAAHPDETRGVSPRD